AHTYGTTAVRRSVGCGAINNHTTPEAAATAPTLVTMVEARAIDLPDCHFWGSHPEAVHTSPRLTIAPRPSPRPTSTVAPPTRVNTSGASRDGDLGPAGGDVFFGGGVCAAAANGTSTVFDSASATTTLAEKGECPGPSARTVCAPGSTSIGVPQAAS